SHWSTSKTPSYTKSVSWQHHPFQFARYFNKSINRNRATNSSNTAMSTVNFCVSVSIRSPY
ncbi:hypothetical protein SND67_21330, partial [Escherichia coli]|nr:hypothetical protein [Escherichia coli]